MNERDIIATSTDLGQLRLKRGERKRNINKIRSYNESIDGLMLKQIKEDEVRRQLGLLEQQTDLYELIQDRILELLEKLDNENRLEEEESEAAEQRHVQRDLREQLGAALCSVQAYSMSQGIKERLQILDETDTLSGAHLEKQIDEARKELKELSLLKEKSGECTEIQDITKELNRTAHQLALRFEKENGITTTTILIKLSENRHNIRTLPSMNFQGDPLEWRNF